MRGTIYCCLRLVLKRKEMKAKDFGAPEEFWNENVVLCKRCGEPIAFAKDENDKWIVMRPDFKGHHQCKIIKEVK